MTVLRVLRAWAGEGGCVGDGHVGVDGQGRERRAGRARPPWAPAPSGCPGIRGWPRRLRLARWATPSGTRNADEAPPPALLPRLPPFKSPTAASSHCPPALACLSVCPADPPTDTASVRATATYSSLRPSRRRPERTSFILPHHRPNTGRRLEKRALPLRVASTPQQPAAAIGRTGCASEQLTALDHSPSHHSTFLPRLPLPNIPATASPSRPRRRRNSPQHG